jgi:hypothetical protein
MTPSSTIAATPSETGATTPSGTGAVTPSGTGAGTPSGTSATGTDGAPSLPPSGGGPGSSTATTATAADDDEGLLVRLVTAGRLSSARTASLPTFDVLAGSPATFVLDPAALGHPPPLDTMDEFPPAVFDLWRVDVSGIRPSTGRAVRASVPVSIRRNAWRATPSANVYAFELALPPDEGATYSLEVFLQQAAFHSSTFQSDECSVTRAPQTLKATISLVTVAAAALQQQQQQQQQPMPNDGITSDLFRGWYESNNSTLDAAPFTWHSASAATAMRYFTPSEARTCLAGKWLAFVGDSTMEELAISTVLLTNTSFEEDWTNANCPSLGFRAARMFDTDAVASRLKDIGARVTMVNAPAAVSAAKAAASPLR